MNLLKQGSTRFATLVVVLGVVGTWVYSNVVAHMAYLEILRAVLTMQPGSDIPDHPQIIEIPGWAVTLVLGALGAKQLEKQIEMKHEVVIPPPER